MLMRSSRRHTPDTLRRRPQGLARGLSCVLLATLSLLAPATASAGDAAADSSVAWYFYEGRDFGSERMVGPLRLILNGGLGILQMENRSNKLSDIDWENGWKGLTYNLGHPFGAIEAKGWWEFVKSEIIPFSFNSGDSQYWPNYTNHLIGGGMSYRMMREWYRWHGFRHERTWAFTTLMAYHLVNETVEMNKKSGYRVDPISDVYIFNGAGMLLFESDRVSRFFSRTLHMRDWSFLPLYDPGRGTIENNGQNYMIRLNLKRSSPWMLFYHWGNSGELGASRRIGDGHYVSFGAGFKAKNLFDVDELTEGAELATTFGFFYDREGSLLSSLLYARTKDNRWRLNLYPGLFRLGPFRPGVTLIVSQDKDVRFGLTLGCLRLPAGLATGD